MENDLYTSFKIKQKTARDFRKFSRNLGKPQTETLQLMLDFFHLNALSPLDELGPNFTTLDNRIKKRINTVIAIVRDIEKTQTKPTLAMLQLLFQQVPAKQEVLVEKNRLPKVQENSQELQFQKRNQLLQQRLSQTEKITSAILERVIVSRSSFGRVQLRLMMTQQELEEIKLEFENL